MISIYFYFIDYDFQYLVLGLYHGLLPGTFCECMDVAGCIKTLVFCHCKISSLESRNSPASSCRCAVFSKTLNNDLDTEHI